MKQVLQDYGSGELQIAEAPRPTVSPTEILVQNHYSLVSAGTEKSMIEFASKNLLEKARERPDLVKQVIDKAKTDGILDTYQSVTHRLNQPVPLGYSCAGRVIDVGEDIDKFAIGDRVACGGSGHASHAEVVSVPRNLTVHIPEGVSVKEASFVTVGAIALQGVRRANITLGERVGVLGLGLVGKLVVQILDAYGFPTIGMDIDPSQIEKAKQIGLDTGAVIGQDNVEEVAANFTDGAGLDAVIIAAGTESNEPVDLAGQLCRDKGTVSVIGNVGMDIPRDPYYEKELDFGISRSYGPGRYARAYEEKGLDYPIGYVRWTEGRNMEEFLRLMAEESVNVETMITHEFSIEDALDAYNLILDDSGNEDVTGVVIEYNEEKEHAQMLSFRSTRRERRDKIGVGVVGGGTFAEGTILPILEDLNVHLAGIATASGSSAQHIAKKFDFDFATTEYMDVLENDAIDLVIVATRNNLHAEIAVEALQREKDVHVEKPLALDRTELRDVVEAEQNSSGRLMIGFNRRFAPQSVTIKDQLANRSTPLMMNYRVSVDQLPSDHWIADPEEGGGRIIAELCHFVDFLQFMADAKPERLHATTISPAGSHDMQDNLNVIISFAEGSVGNVLYTTLGDPSTPKEFVEIFGKERTFEIDNFKYGRIVPISQNKGHQNQFTSLISAIRNGEQAPIPIEEIVTTTQMTFDIKKSITTGQPVSIDFSEFTDYS